VYYALYRRVALIKSKKESGREMSNLKKITLLVDEEWLKAISNLTQDVYEGEMCKWLSVEDCK
jgi:hypothetical protein